MKQVLLVLVAVFGVHSGLVFAGETQTTSASVTLDYKSNNTKVYIETSDFAAAWHDCRTEGSYDCEVTDQQTSIPKNMANWLCLDGDVVTASNYVITPNCQSLLDQGKGSCMPISTTAGCAPNPVVAPACFWRTSSNASTPASWTWKVTQRADGLYQVDCSNSGYQDVSPK